MQNKRRIYTPSQESLEIIKDRLTAMGRKSNNTTAVHYACDEMADFIARQELNREEAKDCCAERKTPAKRNVMASVGAVLALLGTLYLVSQF